MPVFFEKILEDLHATKEECLMIGDSLSSDVKGANAVGIDCVWLNQRGTPLPEGVSAVQISSLAELKNLL
jgi:FMN phosphatase YigB (HAD superfamily)